MHRLVHRFAQSGDLCEDLHRRLLISLHLVHLVVEARDCEQLRLEAINLFVLLSELFQCTLVEKLVLLRRVLRLRELLVL